MHIFQLIQKPVYQAILFVLLTITLVFIIKPKSAYKLWGDLWIDVFFYSD